MAAYPSFGQRKGSMVDWDDDLVLDFAVGGGAKGRRFYTARKGRFLVKHKLNSTDSATLMTFYDTNANLTFTFVWSVDGATYTCLFMGPPKPSSSTGVWTDYDVRIRAQ